MVPTRSNRRRAPLRCQEPSVENRNPIGLRREQVQALGVLIKQPDVFSALESVFADMRATALRDYDAVRRGQGRAGVC
jgi:hypothetical protein